MSTGEVFLGIIAAAVSVMALIQIGAVVAGVRLARRVDDMARQLELEIKPLLTHVTTMSSEAARAATLAASQVERIDQLLGRVTERAEQTFVAAQQFISGPARNSVAIITGVRAAVSAFKGLSESSRRRSAVRGAPNEDDESLFIG